MATYWIGFFEFGSFGSGRPDIFLECDDCGRPKHGKNGILINSDNLRVNVAHTKHGSFEVGGGEPTLSGHIDNRALFESAFSEFSRGKFDSERFQSLIPLIALTAQGSDANLYVLSEQTLGGIYGLSLGRSGVFSELVSYSYAARMVEDTLSKVANISALCRSGAAYFRWNPDMELERKFTFQEPPDIWDLAVKLHQQLLSRIGPFVPEPNKGFQVWDYENFPFEVLEPPGEKGYISFIPQVDGRTTVKRKWFVQNSELRRETVTPNRIVPEFHHEAFSISNGRVRQLASFNRTRFDINFESLETGHVFGIYFDKCATLSPPHLSFGQAELEYCRTRTAARIVDIWDEFEFLTVFLENFLLQEGVSFERNLYSKIDFARAATDFRAEDN